MNDSGFDAPEMLIVQAECPIRSLALATRMVDLGVYFAFDPPYELPAALPSDLSNFKLIVLPRAVAAAEAERLDAFRKAGGSVTVMDEEDWQSEALIERLPGKAGLALDHPGMARRLEAVPDRDVFQATLRLSMEYLRPEWHDVLRYNIECLVEAYDVTGDEAILQHAGELVDLALSARPAVPVTCDHVSCIYAMLNYMDRSGRPELLDTCRQVVDLYLERASRFRGVISNYTRADEEGLLRAEIAFQFCPALARLSRYTGEAKYAEYAVDQLVRLEEELRDGETGLWYLGVGRAGRTPCLWARGCSFSFRGIVDTLAELDADRPGRRGLAEMLGRLAEALRRHQDGRGEWRQVMNETWTRPEGSATAWCVAGFAKALRHGWLDDSFDDAVRKGWAAVKRRAWQGYSTRVCGGVTGSMDPEYYRFRRFLSPSYGHFNLLAATEMLRRQ